MAQDPKLAGKEGNIPPFPTVCLIGPSGVGKSSFGNVLLGKDAFKVEHNSVRGTVKTNKMEGKLLGHKIQVVDTVGLEYDDQDGARVMDVVRAIKDIKQTSVLGLVVKSSNAKTKPFFPIITKYNAYVKEDFLMNHLIIVFTDWSLSKDKVRERKKNKVTQESIKQSFLDQLKKEYPKIEAFANMKVPCIFVDCQQATDEGDSDEEEDDIQIREKIKGSHNKELKKFYDIAKTFPRLEITIANVANQMATGVYNKVTNIVYSNNNITYNKSSNSNDQNITKSETNVSNTNSNNNNKNSGVVTAGTASASSGSSGSSKSSGNGCVSMNERVNILICKSESNYIIKQCLLKDVKLNDLVETKDGFKKVIHVYYGDIDEKSGLYLNTMQCFTVKHKFGTISLTKYHLIYIKDRIEPVMAYQLKIGDYLDCGNKTFSKIEQITTSIQDTQTIITQNGEFIASGIRVSSYTHTTKLHCFRYLLPLTSIAPKMSRKMEEMLTVAVNTYLKPKQEKK